VKRTAVNRRRWLFLVAVAAATLVSWGAALTVGALVLPLETVWEALWDANHQAAPIVRGLRLERAAATFAAGGLLAVAGTLMQVLLRNPLADPYLLGVSGGAAVGALTVILLGGAAYLVAGAAFVGALATVALVFALARLPMQPWSSTRLILTGVIIASGAGALVAFLLTIAPEGRLHSMLFWLMGDASFAQNPGWALVLLAAAVFGLVPWLRDLDLLPYGEISAQALGVPVAALRVTLLALASLLTATAVTLVGSVGFVGLIVPHALRLVIGANHRWLLPMAALAGGTLLTAADTLARTAWAPQQLPVGIAMALIGVPFFLWLLARTKGG